jgi:hypothetical protein
MPNMTKAFDPTGMLKANDVYLVHSDDPWCEQGQVESVRFICGAGVKPINVDNLHHQGVTKSTPLRSPEHDDVNPITFETQF